MFDYIEVDGEKFEVVKNFSGRELVIKILRPLNRETWSNDKPIKINGWRRFKTKELRGACKLDYYEVVGK